MCSLNLRTAPCFALYILTFHTSSGSGSDRRRKAIINETLSNDALFMSLMTGFRNLFVLKMAEFQEALHAAVSAYLETVRENFDLVRNEPVARQGEQNNKFRDRVSEAADNVRECARRFRPVISI